MSVHADVGEYPLHEAVGTDDERPPRGAFLVREIDAVGLGDGGIFIGEKGTFTVDRGRISSDPEDLAIDIMKKRPRGYNSSHIANWLAAMKSRAKPSADVEIGHRSGSVCHLGNIARWTGRKLTWDPVKEVFPNDPEANTHLDRPRRKQWELPKTV